MHQQPAAIRPQTRTTASSQITTVLKGVDTTAGQRFLPRLLHNDQLFRTPRELLILRHAKSDWDLGVESDFVRPLAKRGKRDAPRVGEWLYREGLVPSLVVSSPAERARQTALRVCRSMDFQTKHIVWEEGIYEGRLADLMQVVARFRHDLSPVLLIGHNPGLEELLRYLAGDDIEDPRDGKLLPTAAVARLEMPDDWARLDPGCAQLVSITRPRKKTKAKESG